MTRHSPPAASDQFGALAGGDVFEIYVWIKKRGKVCLVCCGKGSNDHTFYARVARVTSEFVLLTVGAAEDVVPDDVERKNGTKFYPA
jgi:hypothetical protein